MLPRLTCLLLLAGVSPATSAAQNVDRIVSEALLDAPIDQVWEAWSTGEGLRRWLAPHAEIDLRLGGTMRTNYDPRGSLGDPGTIENEILSFDPGRMLSIRVARAPEGFPFPAAIREMWTVIHLEPVEPGRTRIRVVGLGFGPGEESQRMREFFQQGNDATLVQLQGLFPPR